MSASRGSGKEKVCRLHDRQKVERDYEVDYKNFEKERKYIPDWPKSVSELILSSYYGRLRNVDFLIDQGVDPAAG